MDSDQRVLEEQRGEGEARRGSSKRGREEEEQVLGPLRGQERRDTLSRRQGRGVGK